MQPRIRLLRRAAGVLLAVVLIGCLAVWMALRGSLPRYSGTLRSDALRAAVTVERDALGTATLHAANRDDIDWALGYVHAQERFFEMDLLRRRAAGELAELFGAAALPADRRARAHRMRARAAADAARLPDEQRQRLQRYSDGVNAGLADLDVRPLAYLLTRTQPAAWRSEDTLLVVAAMAFTLNDAENVRELAFSRMHAALPASAFDLLAASGGAWDAPIAGAPLDLPALPTASELDLHALDAKLLHGDDASSTRIPGSNAFAVDGSLTGGGALVANDMHLDLRVPALWFRARLVYPNARRAGEDVDLVGATLPGTPAMIVGSNRRVAWGFTNSYVDTTDWVRVMRDPADANRYRGADGWLPIEKHAEVIKVHGGADETLAVEETRWGPILANDTDGTPLALAWTAHEPGAFNLELAKMAEAETVDEAVAVAQASGLPPQNFIAADRDGKIAWTIAGRLPRREGGYDMRLPADWTQPGRGWNGWLDARDYPLVSNPPWHRLWSANQRAIEGAALARVGDGGYDIGARARQIRDDLRAREKFAPADLLAIQLDDRALFLDRWKDLLQLELNRAPKTPLHAAIAQALHDWKGHASIDSVGYRIVRAWRAQVVDAVLDGFAAAVRGTFPDFTMPRLNQAEHPVWAILGARPAHLLPPNYPDWDALLIAAADRAALSLDAQPGGIAARTWGERNTTHIAHPLSRALPGWIASWLDMSARELPGDSNMPRVQGVDFGASERCAVAPGDEEHGYFMMAGGQSGHPLSPYYGSGHTDWAEGTPTPFLPGAAERVLRLEPTAR